MKILFFTKNFPSPWDTTRASFNLDMVASLSRFAEVRVIAPVGWIDRWRGGSSRVGLRVERRDGLDVRHPWFFYTPGLFHRQHNYFLWWSVRPAVASLLREWKPDVVLSYWALPDGDVALRIARLAQTPTAVIVAGSDVLLLTRDPAWRTGIASVLARADAVLTLSEQTRETVVGLGVDPARTTMIRRGVNREVFFPSDRQASRARLGLPADRPVLVWVGRMVAVKALDVLLHACARLKQAGQSFSLCLIGEGPLQASMAQLTASLGLEKDVRFVGPVPHADLADWYRAATVTVLPSRSEGLPNVLLESIACGTPFVATAVGGIPEIADAGHDHLIPPGDPEALALAIEAGVRAAPPTGNRRVTPPGAWESAEALVQVLRSLGRTAPVWRSRRLEPAGIEAGRYE
jgi:glycosyltransferase involved in cell wall biosynthesis